MHPAAFGSSHNMNENDQEATTVPGQALGCSNGAELRRQRSCTRGEEASQGDSLLNRDGETTVDSHWPDEDVNVSYKHLDDSEVSEKSQWSHHLLDRPTKALYKKDQRSSGKLSGMVESIYLLILVDFFHSFTYENKKLSSSLSFD